MHKKENIGQVELATIAFGQSFQITPLQLATTAASLINGGERITPHFGVKVQNRDGKVIKTYSYEEKKENSFGGRHRRKCAMPWKMVVKEGGGKKRAGGRISDRRGKTATSQTLPRSANRYISSFLGFAPADDPVILGVCIIYNPQGIYYGGTIAAPVMKTIFENVLPYLGIDKTAVVTEESKTE